MNGIEKITQRIADECKAQCLSVAEEAEKRCAAIKAEYEAKANAAYEDRLAKGKEEIEQDVQRQDRNVRLDSKKDILAEKQNLVDSAFNMAREKILGMDQGEYVAFLAKQAAAAASTGEEEVILSEKDVGSLGAQVIAKANELLSAAGKTAALKLSAQNRPMAGGLVLRAGDVEVNCTVDALLDQCRDELAAKIVGILFN